MILRLTLHKKYFYQILNKEKTIEYREIKSYWNKKFENNNYETILFINGYGNKRPCMKIELKEIKKTNKFYELYLGNILEIGNLPEANGDLL